MRSKQLQLFLSTLILLVLFSCNKKTEEFTSEPLSEYMPLQVGKSIVYRLDSTVFINFGKQIEVHSYQEKQIVDAKISDNLGRESYRMLRFIRDTAGIQPWAPAGSFFITPTDKTIEVVENNLRFVKLALPIAQDHSWRGNGYLPNDPFLSSYTLPTAGIEFWDYTYSSINGSITANGKTYDSVITVDVVDESKSAQNASFNVTDPTVPIAYVSYLQQRYAKGVGLVQEKFILWEYQTVQNQPGSGKKTGFGVNRLIIDHN